MAAIPMPARETLAEFEKTEPVVPKLYDAGGHTVQPQNPTLMARLDARAAEKIELSRGTLWLLGAGVIILNLLFSYGGSLLGWAREDGEQRNQVIQIQSDIQRIAASQERIDAKLQKFDERLQQQEIQAAKIDGFKAGVAETQSDKRGK